ncbi:MAG: histidinol-phosphate transaminase [Sterolibacterium sp.]
MSFSDLAPSYIRAISPYQPGQPITQLSRDIGIPVDKIVKLASNENPLGMSPKARIALEQAISGIERYPDQYDLTLAIAERYGVDMGQVVLGNGSNDVLDLVARVYMAPGRSAVFSQHAFAVYPLATMSAGGECIQVPAKNFGHDLSAMASAVRSDTTILWIANPNNPTGTFLPYQQIQNFLQGLNKNVVVVLDEAYNDYLLPALREDTVRWLSDFPNLVIIRTFSKVYGLAGLRVGYAVASKEIADLMHRVRQPFNVNNLALAAAIAALDDHVFVAESYELNRRGLEQIVAGLKRIGLDHIPSHGNFITFRAGDAGKVNQSLLKQGIIVRPLGGYGMPEYLRVSIGLEKENVQFLEALEKSLARS